MEKGEKQCTLSMQVKNCALNKRKGIGLTKLKGTLRSEDLLDAGKNNSTNLIGLDFEW